MQASKKSDGIMIIIPIKKPRNKALHDLLLSKPGGKMKNKDTRQRQKRKLGQLIGGGLCESDQL